MRRIILLSVACLVDTIFTVAQQPLVSQELLIFEVLRSHSDTAYSIGLLWRGDQSDAETSTSQLTTLTRDIHAPDNILTCSPSNWTAADLCVGHGGTEIGLLAHNLRNKKKMFWTGLTLPRLQYQYCCDIKNIHLSFN